MDNPYEPPRSEPLPRRSDDGQGKATASLVIGLVSMVAWLLPIVGLPLAIAGLVLGVKGLGPERRGTAIAGIVLSGLFLVATLLNMALGVFLALTGQHPLVP